MKGTGSKRLAALVPERFIPRTARERYGLVILAFVAGLVAASHVGDVAAERRDELASLRSERRAADAGINSSTWQARAAAAQERLAAWRSRSWEAQTSGVAAATVTAAIEGLGERANLSFVRVEVDPEPVLLEARSILRFELSARSEEAAEMGVFLAALAAHKPVLVVTEMRLVTPEEATTSMTASGYAPLLSDAAS